MACALLWSDRPNPAILCRFVRSPVAKCAPSYLAPRPSSLPARFRTKKCDVTPQPHFSWPGSVMSRCGCFPLTKGGRPHAGSRWDFRRALRLLGVFVFCSRARIASPAPDRTATRGRSRAGAAVHAWGRPGSFLGGGGKKKNTRNSYCQCSYFELPVPQRGTVQEQQHPGTAIKKCPSAEVGFRPQRGVLGDLYCPYIFL